MNKEDIIRMAQEAGFETMIRKDRIYGFDRDGNSTLEIELYDKVGVLRILAKASGLLDNPEESDKPSVIGINVHAPPKAGRGDIVDVKDDQDD